MSYRPPSGDPELDALRAEAERIRIEEEKDRLRRQIARSRHGRFPPANGAPGRPVRPSPSDWRSRA